MDISGIDKRIEGILKQELQTEALQAKFEGNVGALAAHLQKEHELAVKFVVSLQEKYPAELGALSVDDILNRIQIFGAAVGAIQNMIEDTKTRDPHAVFTITTNLDGSLTGLVENSTFIGMQELLDDLIDDYNVLVSSNSGIYLNWFEILNGLELVGVGQFAE